MAAPVLLEWTGREYDHEPKSADWFWALGIIGAASTVAAILFAQYLLAVLIVVAAGSLALHANKVPKEHRFRLVEDGLMIGEELHPFSRMLSFCSLEHIDGEEAPWLSVKTESWLSPHLVIPLEGVNPDVVYAHFLRHVDEDAHHHTVVELVAAWLGF